MRRFGSVVLLMIILYSAQAQKYGNTLGLRFGNGTYRTLGMSFEQRLFKHTTFEGIFQSDFSYNTQAVGLIKQHHPILGKRVNLFTGAGLSFGIEESVFEKESTKEIVRTYGNSTLGADVIIGAEITLLGIHASLDYKPNFNLVGRQNWYQGQVGISVRKVLLSDRELKKKRRKRIRETKRDERKKKRAGS